MINFFKKLQNEGHLQDHGSILDLGSGIGNVSEPFFKAGYEVTLVDKNADVLQKAAGNFQAIRPEGYKIVTGNVEDFSFEGEYDGIILSNVLPFQEDKQAVARMVQDAFAHLTPGGFLYFTLFGTKDQWAVEQKEGMSFYGKEEALQILPAPYYLSEDFGTGSTMKGDLKLWHIFSFLYIK